MLDARDPSSWRRAFTPKTRLLHVESPTNPMLCLVDLRAAAALAHEHEALCVHGERPRRPASQRAEAAARLSERPDERA